MTRYFYQKWRPPKGLGFFCIQPCRYDGDSLKGEDLRKIMEYLPFSYGKYHNPWIERHVIVYCSGNKFVRMSPLAGIRFVLEEGETYGYDIFIHADQLKPD